MIAVLVGLIFIALGLWGLMLWPNDFILAAKGLGPFFTLLSGLIALIAGLASFQSRRIDEKSKKK